MGNYFNKEKTRIMDAGKWTPGNPLKSVVNGMGILDEFNEPDFGTYTPANASAKKIGGYAWGMYGLLIIANTAYYFDLWYQAYTMSMFSNSLMFNDIFGTANALRIGINMVAWSLAGIFWAITFTKEPATWVLFGDVAMALAIIELGRILLVIIMQCMALIVDKWDNPSSTTGKMYSKYDYFHVLNGWAVERTGGTSSHKTVGDHLWFDRNLEIMNISIQFLAFPLYNYGINNYWRAKAVKAAKKAGGKKVYVEAKPAYEKKAEVKVNREEESNDFGGDFF